MPNGAPNGLGIHPCLLLSGSQMTASASCEPHRRRVTSRLRELRVLSSLRSTCPAAAPDCQTLNCCVGYVRILSTSMFESHLCAPCSWSSVTCARSNHKRPNATSLRSQYGRCDNGGCIGGLLMPQHAIPLRLSDALHPVPLHVPHDRPASPL